MTRRFFAAALLVIVAAAAPAQFSADGLYVLPDGIRAYQISSYDKTGGNDDGNRKWAYLDFSREARDFVIFNATGPGRLTRFWMTGWRNPGVLSYHVDGDLALEMPVLDVFAGTVEPFVYPLVGDEEVSSGGFFSYVPFDFSNGMTIRTAAVSRYIQMQYYRYADDLSRAREDARDELIRTERYPLSRTRAAAREPAAREPADSQTTVATIAPGSTAELVTLNGPGLVERLVLELPQAAARATGDAERALYPGGLGELRLQVRADAASAPQINAPLSELFGGTLTGEPVAATPVTVRSAGDVLRLELAFPMPFGASLEVALVNESARAVTPAAFFVEHRTIPQIDDLLADGTIGQLYAVHREHDGFVPGRDAEFVDFVGTGRLVGVVLVASSEDPENRRILEGDDRIYIDDAPTPQIHGTGTEDFFNGGWYYKFGPFSLPTHGNPAHIVTGSADHTSQYRYLMTDSIPFYRRLRMTMEHGPTNDEPGAFSSTVVFYAQPEAVLHLTDEIQAGDLAGESPSGETLSRESIEAPLIGTDTRELVQTTEMRHEAPLRFTATVDPANGGVLLRRLTNYVLPNQSAEVIVNGEPAGVWLTPGFSPDPGVASSELQIPPALTKGESELEIEIRPTTPWSVLHYEVYSVVR